jgi:N-acetylmuramoyl-L-alanine amidase
MVPVRQMLVASKNYKLKCPNTLVPEGFCVHNTWNDASANNEVQYMINSTSSTSYHYAVDDKEVVQGIPLDRNAWHAGDGNNGPGNRKFIGLEICYSKSGGERYTKAEENAVQFLAQELKARGWGIDKVKKHQDFSGKYCPHRILDEKRWTSFLDRIEAAMKSEPKPSVVYEAHVQDIGWQGKRRDGETAGTTGQYKRIEALTVKLENSDAKLEMTGHIQGKGWTNVRTNGEVVGTMGEGLQLEAICISCDKHTITYRVHIEGLGWTNWMKNGEGAGTTGQGLRIEAIEVKIDG